MGDVEMMRKDAGPAVTSVDEPPPGIDVGYAFSIDEKRSLSIRTMFSQGISPEGQEKILSRIFNVCSVMGLREKLIEHRREKSNAERRLKEVSVDPKRKQEISAEIDALTQSKLVLRNTMENQFRASDRTGPFTPAGKDKNQLDAIDRDAEKLQGELTNLEDDMKRQRDELMRAIGLYDVAISNAESEISIRREAYGD